MNKYSKIISATGEVSAPATVSVNASTVERLYFMEKKLIYWLRCSPMGSAFLRACKKTNLVVVNVSVVNQLIDPPDGALPDLLTTEPRSLWP